MPIAFKEAIAEAKQFLQDQRHSEGRDLYDGREMEALLIGRISENLFMMPAAALEACKHSARGQEFLRHALALKIEAGEPIPIEFRELAAGFLRGTAPQPKRNAGRKESWFLHSRIAWAVMHLKAEGMKATRTDDSKRKESACDAVAAALGELKLSSITYGQVKRIYLEKRSLIEVFRIIQSVPSVDQK
jgi:hypothetical protein